MLWPNLRQSCSWGWHSTNKTQAEVGLMRIIKQIYQMNPHEIISCRSRTNGTYFISLMGQPGKCFFHVTIMVPPRYSTVGWRQLVVNKTLTRPRWIGDPRKIQRLLRSSSMDWNPTKRMPKRYYLREMKRATWCLHVTNLFGGYINSKIAWRSCVVNVLEFVRLRYCMIL